VQLEPRRRIRDCDDHARNLRRDGLALGGRGIARRSIAVIVREPRRGEHDRAIHRLERLGESAELLQRARRQEGCIRASHVVGDARELKVRLLELPEIEGALRLREEPLGRRRRGAGGRRCGRTREAEREAETFRGATSAHRRFGRKVFGSKAAGAGRGGGVPVGREAVSVEEGARGGGNGEATADGALRVGSCSFEGVAVADAGVDPSLPVGAATGSSPAASPGIGEAWATAAFSSARFEERPPVATAIPRMAATSRPARIHPRAPLSPFVRPTMRVVASATCVTVVSPVRALLVSATTTPATDAGGVGACKAGTQSCGKDTWGDCVGAIGPAPEMCNGVDDDCDGLVDEGNPDGGNSCSSGSPGVCSSGAFVCQAGKLVCVEGKPGGAESCNGVDDDCDGAVDDGNPEGGATCATGAEGACAAGKLTCTNGKLVCGAIASPTAETCNGVDDDCDGLADEGNPDGGASCDSGAKGACAAGELRCVAGKIACQSKAAPNAEACNGVDDDCDGVTDQGNPGGGASCDTGAKGACAAGELRCVAGKIVCESKVGPSAEVCNVFDDDCDGVVDQGNPGGGVACNTGLLGPCQTGETACVAGSLACQETFPAGLELCNGIDDDCNGFADDQPIDCPFSCGFQGCFGDIP